MHIPMVWVDVGGWGAETNTTNRATGLRPRRVTDQSELPKQRLGREKVPGGGVAMITANERGGGLGGGGGWRREYLNDDSETRAGRSRRGTRGNATRTVRIGPDFLPVSRGGAKAGRLRFPP